MMADVVDIADHLKPFPPGQITREFVIHMVEWDKLATAWRNGAYETLATCDGFKTDAPRIYEDLETGHAQLLHYPPGAWAISKFIIDEDGKKELFLWYLANSQKEPKDPFMPSARALMLLFESWAIAEGCNSVGFYGNLLWKKVVPEYKVYAKYTKLL